MSPDLQQPKNNTLQEDDDCISNVTSSHNEYIFQPMSTINYVLVLELL